MTTNSPWADTLLLRFEERDRQESKGYEAIFKSHADIQDQLSKLSSLYIQVTRENKLLQKENQTLLIRSESSPLISHANVAELEQRLLRLQTEVIDLHREKEKLTKALQEKDQKVKQLASRVETLLLNLKEYDHYKQSWLDQISELKDANKTLLDEQTITMLTIQKLEEGKRQLEEDKTKCLLQILALQQQVEELKNFESDLKRRLHREAVQKGLMEAASVQLPNMETSSTGRANVIASVPNKVITKMMAANHVNCVRYSPSGQLFSSGGLDCKVYLWTMKNDKCESQALVGCNAGISAVDFDPGETMLLGASSDFAVRVWTVADRRLKVNLTGHSDRVVAARFLDDSEQIVTASADRTIKLWNLQKAKCTRTMLTTSACHDVIGCQPLSIIISGHFDKKLRMWDIRAGSVTNEVVLSNRISGLDISLDNNYVLACTRNDSLHTIELRRNEVVRSFQADGFQINFDKVHPCFSPDGAYVACGSRNGGIFIWDTNTGQLKTVLEEHENMVVCTCWSPLGHSLISCESGKKIVVWSQF